MGVPKKRTSKMRRDRRRAANNNLRTAVNVVTCLNCKEPVLTHRACSACGHYAGREAITVVSGA